ncbi:Tyrosine-protein phosphatase non-receptor type 9 [Aphelenchoides fujianensis]|nr:Tyrosine-protein phosphatase non-receptor type 9 [Aphelenchoides fujianensis]
MPRGTNSVPPPGRKPPAAAAAGGTPKRRKKGPRSTWSENQEAPGGRPTTSGLNKEHGGATVKGRTKRTTRPMSRLETSQNVTGVVGGSEGEFSARRAFELDRDKPTSEKQKAMLLNFCKRAFDMGVRGILAEYQHIAAYLPPNYSKLTFEANMDKNRYHDVGCIDATRVVLKNYGNDYIHANYVRGDPLVNTFICTQAPMMTTVKDFWRMVFQEEVGNIFMLCDTIEQGKSKCEQYWPRDKGCTMEWPEVKVRNMNVDTSDTTTITTTLELVYFSHRMVLKHHLWRTWPDRSVPQSVMAPFRLLKVARTCKRPTIVHCSAGIGRTGTVVGLEIALQQALSEQELVMTDVVKRLRNQRVQAVQTDLQFVYMYKCMMAYSVAAQLLKDDENRAKYAAFEKEYHDLLRERAQMAEANAYTPLVPVLGFGGHK